MNLIFENIGDIKKASINFKKLTVISGENDVGKSTVGKLIDLLRKLMSIHPIDPRGDQIHP